MVWSLSKRVWGSVVERAMRFEVPSRVLNTSGFPAFYVDAPRLLRHIYRDAPVLMLKHFKELTGDTIRPLVEDALIDCGTKLEGR